MQYLTLSSVARIVTSILLFIGVSDLPYDYYNLLRWIVTPVSLWTLFLVFQLDENLSRGGVAAYLINTGAACAFNPIFPIHADRFFWITVDAVYGLYLFASIFFIGEKIDYSRREERRQARNRSKAERQQSRAGPTTKESPDMVIRAIYTELELHEWRLQCPICSHTWTETAPSVYVLVELLEKKYPGLDSPERLICPSGVSGHLPLSFETILVLRYDEKDVNKKISQIVGHGFDL